MRRRGASWSTRRASSGTTRATSRSSSAATPARGSPTTRPSPSPARERGAWRGRQAATHAAVGPPASTRRRRRTPHTPCGTRPSRESTASLIRHPSWAELPPLASDFAAKHSTKGVEQHVLVHSASCCAGGLPGITGPTLWSRWSCRLKPRPSSVKCGGVLRWPTAYGRTAKTRDGVCGGCWVT